MTVKTPAEPAALRALPFFDDPSEPYARLAPLGDAVLLDSAAAETRGRFDIIAAEPDAERALKLPAGAESAEVLAATGDWADAADQLCEAATPGLESLPFHGGFIGHLSYELGRRLQGLQPAREGSLPLAVVRYYPWAIVQDRVQQKSWLVGGGDDRDPGLQLLSDRLRATLAADSPAESAIDFSLLETFRAHWSLDGFAQRFARVKDYIAAGDCYQINIGQPFRARFRGDLLQAYRALRPVARAPFSGFFPLEDDRFLLSLSPERFLTVDRGRVETRPIKGTRPRHRDAAQDAAAAQALLDSEKERAENLMIVDMLRNDLGRCCKAGSIRVDALFQLESYSTVHHLVSVVSGELGEHSNPARLLLGCLPGGSITGAPKHRAMQIIDELEPASRQAWCGTLFYISRHGRMDSNITIRSLFNEGGELHCWAGGGLVDDSQAEAEFEEQYHKVGAFFAALEAL